MQPQPISQAPVRQTHDQRPNTDLIYFLVSLALFIIIALLSTDSNMFVG